MSEGAQGFTNGIIRLSVIKFPKIAIRCFTDFGDDNDVVDEENSCAETKC